MNNIPEYLNTLLEHQGVAVAHVKDGWVIYFSKDKMSKLLEDIGEADRFMIFVKSTETEAKN